MNESGDAVGPARGELRVPLENVIAIHDEIDLPFGEIREKLGGGVAGHNGLKIAEARARQRRLLAPARGRQPARLDRSRCRLGLRARPLQRAARRGREADLRGGGSDRAPGRPDRRLDRGGDRVTNPALTTYDVPTASRCCSSTGPRRATRSTCRCSRSCSSTWRSARADESVRALVISSTDHMGLSAGADVREQLDERGPAAPDGALRAALRRADRLSEADGRGLSRRLRRRRRRDRRRLRPADRRLEPAPALSRRGARRAGRPGPPGHPLRALGRQVPAPDRRRRSPSTRRTAGASCIRSCPLRGPRTRRSSSPRRSRRTRPRRSRGRSGCCTSGTGSRSARAPRARARSRGSEPGPGLPHGGQGP